MNNEKWLTHYIESIKIVNGHKAVAVYSLDFRFLYASDKYLSITGATASDLIGKRFRETNAPGIELADQLEEISLEIAKSGKKASFIVIYDSPVDKVKRCHRFEAYTTFNPDTNEPVCRVGEVQLLNLNLIGQLFNFSNLIPYNKNNNVEALNPMPKFSTREQEILFLLILGKSYKEIASILGTIYNKTLAPSTISSMTSRQLLPKFNSFTVDNMLNKAIKTKALQYIPASLLSFNNGIYMLEYSNE